MSPLLGSLGGSSEYAFRGTLDDWPNDFSTSLSSQNVSGISPTDTPVATLTITGLNYKARVVVENPNITVRVVSEINTTTGVGTTAVTDGRQTYALRRQSDPALFIRDQSVIQLRLQPTSGTLSDFSKTYVGIATVGKRSATWIVGVRPIDETPNAFTFSPLIDQELGVGATSNTITVSGLESGFSFPISVSANQVDGVISFYKNSSGPFISSTVANGDQIYLSTQTPNSYETAKTFTVQVGTFTTSWGVLTRVPDTNVAPFSFIGFSSANILSGEYISNEMTVSGSDPGIGLSVRVSGPNAFFEIRDLNNALRYIDPLNPSSTNYWQSGISTAFLTDKIRVKINASANYNTTTVGILTVSDQSGSFIVTTRPTPIDTIPATFTFTDLTDQPRGEIVQSSPITLTGMIPGNFGTASIPSPTATITPQFQVTRGGTIVKAYTTTGSFQVQNSDIINLRMTTPREDLLNGVTNSSITFRVDGTDTTLNIFGGSGYVVSNSSTQDTWNVTTIARSCPITAFSFPSLTGISTNTDTDVVFTPSGYNTDCQMRVDVTSTSSTYNFIELNGSLITPTKILTNVAAGSTIKLRVRASSEYLASVASTVNVNNTSSPVTPQSAFSTSWTITSIGNTTPSSATLTSNLATVEVGKPFTLTWSSVNCISVRSVTWTPAPTLLNGSVALTAPSPRPSSGLSTSTITLYANPAANNYNSLPFDGIGRYVTANATINVIEDTTPIFTPTGFTSVTGASISGIGITSNIMFISDISTPLTGIVTGSTGSSFLDAGILTQKLLNSGDSIILKVNSSPNYLTDTTAYLTVQESEAPFTVKATKSFTVRTADCFPTIATITYPSSVIPGSDHVVLRYYVNSSYITVPGSLSSSNNFLYGDSVNSGIVGFVGDATNYYNVYSTNFGSILFPTTSGYFSSFSPSSGNPVNVTWAKLIDIIYYAYTSALQRPPKIEEIATILNNNAPVGYTTAYTFFDAIRSGLNAPTNSTTRRLSDPIYNSCPAGTSNPIINSGGYPGITTGTYPPPPP